MTEERFLKCGASYDGIIRDMIKEYHSDFGTAYYGSIYETLNANQKKLLCTLLEDYKFAQERKYKNMSRAVVINLKPELVNFNEEKGVTTAKWEDGTITQVRCKEGDIWDPEKALAMVFMKKWCCGNDASKFHKIFKDYLPDDPLAKVMIMPEFINALLHLTGKDSTEPATDESDDK